VKISGKIIVGAALLVAIASAYRIGIKVTTDAYSKQLSGTQTILAFNHLQRYEELLRCANKEKYEAVQTKLEMSIISQKELIANHLKAHDLERVNKYISIRYPNGVESLKTFRSNRGNRWEEPTCE